MKRTRNNIIASVSSDSIISFQSREEIELQRRKNSFMKSGCNCENYSFLNGLKKEFNLFKQGK